VSYLLDTDFSSHFLRGNHRAFSKVVQHAGRLFISAVTVAELKTWVFRSPAPELRAEALSAFLDEVKVLDFDSIIAETFGRVRAKQLAGGELTPTFDLQIAATAITHQLTLVTCNTRDFTRVPGLTFVDWLAP
jgi:tRNA(fMet)-specific endonuclease VapC